MRIKHLLGIVRYHALGFIKGIREYSALSSKYKYILLSDGIGDIIWFGAYFEEFIKQYDTKNIKFVAQPSRKMLLSMLSINPEDIYFLESKEKNNLYYFAKRKCFRKIISGQIDDDDLKVNQVTGQIVRNRDVYNMFSRVQVERLGIEMDVLYKYGYFNLAYECRPAHMQIPDSIYKRTDRYIRECLFEEGCIILVPYANTRINIPSDIWKIIVSKLEQTGKKIYTNCKDKQEAPIEGTTSLIAPLEYMPVIGKKADMIVSARCGLADLLFFAGCNLSVIHYIVGCDQNDYQYIAAMVESFEKMEQRCHIEENRTVRDYRLYEKKEIQEQVDFITRGIVRDIGNEEY